MLTYQQLRDHYQPNKEGIRKRFGGTTTDWTKIRKGDYVETIIDKQSVKNSKVLSEDMLYRGWVGGFENDKKLISIYNFDWKVIGQFDSKKVRLLNRNNDLLIKSMEIEENRINICKLGTIQKVIGQLKLLIDGGDFKKIEKEKEVNIKLDNTIQKGILDAW